MPFTVSALLFVMWNADFPVTSSSSSWSRSGRRENSRLIFGGSCSGEDGSTGGAKHVSNSKCGEKVLVALFPSYTPAMAEKAASFSAHTGVQPSILTKVRKFLLCFRARMNSRFAI